MIVEAYRNLNRKCISVRRGGLVKKCVQRIALRDVVFRVQEGGRKRVLREKRKNVHAFVKGTPTHKAPPRGLCKVDVTYNPYKYASFVTRKGKRPVHAASYVVVRTSGVEAWRPCAS
jgi:hypothetical protein